jgi:MFS family permease
MTTTRRPDDELTLRSIAPAVYLPTLIFEIGQGAITPIVALSGRHLGASVGVAGLLLALLGVGQILGDIPAGALAARIGDRHAMLIAAGLAVVTLIGCALTRDVWLLGLSILFTGMTNAVYSLARQSYLTEVIPHRLRARALSTLGGTARVGAFIGPFLGALVLRGASVQSAYWLAVATSVLAAASLLIIPDVAGPEGVPRQANPVSFRSVFAGHRSVFRTLGAAALMVSAVRGARQTVLPLWADHLHMTASTTSLIFGIAGAVDMLLFYPSGKVMDVAGRVWVAIPSMLVLSAGFFLLPLTHSLLPLTLVAMLLGFGNGIGSGILMTLGADVAPPGARSQFLGIWRVCADSGNAGGPVVVSALAALGSLAAGVLAMGGIGIVASFALARWVPRWSPYANNRRRRPRPVET